MNERLEKLMEELGIDGILVSSQYNVRYLSGFTGDVGCLYVSSGRMVLLTDSRYVTWARGQVREFQVVETGVSRSYEALVSEYVKQDGVRRLGFEDGQMLYAEAVKFMAQSPQTEFVPLGSRLDELRSRKTPEEIEKLRAAEQLGDDAFSHILTRISVGMSEREVALELELYLKRNGAQALSFDTIVASGENSAKPHWIPGERRLQRGDFVTMDFGCVYEGYCSDMTRTIVMGEANSRQREIYELVLRAQQSALDAVAAGKTGREIDGVARGVIAEAGYGDCFGHGLGHGVGLFIHEEPRFSPTYEGIIRENMVVTVEPGVYVPDFGGVRIEDVVVVTENGHENLTSSPKNLIEIGT